jgi:hypothetical protein
LDDRARQEVEVEPAARGVGREHAAGAERDVTPAALVEPPEREDGILALAGDEGGAGDHDPAISLEREAERVIRRNDGSCRLAGTRERRVDAPTRQVADEPKLPAEGSALDARLGRARYQDAASPVDCDRKRRVRSPSE